MASQDIDMLSAPKPTMRDYYFKMHGLPQSAVNLQHYDSWVARTAREPPSITFFDGTLYFTAHNLVKSDYNLRFYQSWRRICKRDPPVILFHEFKDPLPEDRLVHIRIHMDKRYNKNTEDQHATMPGLVGPLTLDEYAWGFKSGFLRAEYHYNKEEEAKAQAAAKAKTLAHALLMPVNGLTDEQRQEQRAYAAIHSQAK